MRRYKLKPVSIDTAGQVFPYMTATQIPSQEVLDRKQDYFYRFFQDNVSFRGMVPSYGHDRAEPHFICDMHSWIERKPPALVYPISPRFHDILIEFYIPHIRFYKGSVVWKGMEHPYYVMHLLTQQYQYIDFQHSTFIKSDSGGNKEARSPVIQRATMDELYEDFSPWLFTFERAVMSPKFRDLDMCHIIIHGIIISEQLKQAIEAAQLIGVEITACPIEFEFSDELQNNKVST